MMVAVSCAPALQSSRPALWPCLNPVASDLRYSTSLTLPFVKVTFMPLK